MDEICPYAKYQEIKFEGLYTMTGEKYTCGINENLISCLFAKDHKNCRTFKEFNKH